MLTKMKVTQKEKKVKTETKVRQKAEKPAKVTKQAKEPIKNDQLDLLKSKLRKKYHLLRNEPLNFQDKDSLLSHVCTVLGMTLPDLSFVIEDL
jgi:hypothetical protein